jgi:hypothetical protein
VLGEQDEQMLQKLWFESLDGNNAYRILYKKFRKAVTQGYSGTMRDWQPHQGSLGIQQLKYKNRLNSVVYIKRAELDGTTFCSLKWSENKGTDNSYITAEYNEETEGDTIIVTCIGRIKFMFIARMSNDDPEQVFISGDWYDIVGNNPVSKNVQVKFNPNFDSERLAFLRDCTPKNLTLVPSSPFVDSSPTCLMDVLDD